MSIAKFARAFEVFIIVSQSQCICSLVEGSRRRGSDCCCLSRDSGAEAYLRPRESAGNASGKCAFELKFYEEPRQFVWICLRRKQATHVVSAVYWKRETGQRGPASCIFFWEMHLTLKTTNNPTLKKSSLPSLLARCKISQVTQRANCPIRSSLPSYIP